MKDLSFYKPVMTYDEGKGTRISTWPDGSTSIGYYIPEGTEPIVFTEKKASTEPPEYAKMVILYMPTGKVHFGVFTRSEKYLTMEGNEVFPEYWADIPT